MRRNFGNLGENIFRGMYEYLSPACAYYLRGDIMASYVSPEVQDKFETLSIDLKSAILERGAQLNNIYDLIAVLEEIVKEAEES